MQLTEDGRQIAKICNNNIGENLSKWTWKRTDYSVAFDNFFTEMLSENQTVLHNLSIIHNWGHENKTQCPLVWYLSLPQCSSQCLPIEKQNLSKGWFSSSCISWAHCWCLKVPTVQINHELQHQHWINVWINTLSTLIYG